MPSVSVAIKQWGPEISVLVGISVPRITALTKASQTVPPPVMARLIVDTGASMTQIDKTVLAQLGITATGTSQILTPSTAGVPHSVNQYDVALYIPGAVAGALLHSVSAWPVIDGDFKSQGIDGLLGRDILQTCHMTYFGSQNVCLLSF